MYARNIFSVTVRTLNEIFFSYESVGDIILY